MSRLTKTALGLVTAFLIFGVVMTLNTLKASETLASDQTYTYVKGDGIDEDENGNVRSYIAGDFKITHRKNDAAYRIASTFTELRVYAKQSLEIYPLAAASRFITSIEFTATDSTYATALTTAAIIAGQNASETTAQSGIASASANIATLNLSNTPNCGFVKFTAVDHVYLSSLKIIYDLAPVTVYSHDFSAGELGTSGTKPDSSITYSGLSWNLTSLWHNSEPAYGFGYDADKGIVIGTNNDSVSSFTLRSQIPDFAIISLEVYASGPIGVNGTIAVSVGGTSASVAAAIPAGSVTNLNSFIFDNPLFGHINISFLQVSNQSLYLDKIIVYGQTSSDITSAMTFARELEAFDTCGQGSQYEALASSYNSLSSIAKDYLNLIMIDDYNKVGETRGQVIQKDIITVNDKWSYIYITFQSTFNADILYQNQSIHILLLLLFVPSIIFCILIVVRHKAR